MNRFNKSIASATITGVPHRNVPSVSNEASTMANASLPGEIVITFGPTRVGKTSLIGNILQTLRTTGENI